MYTYVSYNAKPTTSAPATLCVDREYYDSAKQLFRDVKTSLYRLMELADEKLQKLERCLRLRQFEEQSSQVSSLERCLRLRQFEEQSSQVR